MRANAGAEVQVFPNRNRKIQPAAAAVGAQLTKTILHEAALPRPHHVVVATACSQQVPKSQQNYAAYRRSHTTYPALESRRTIQMRMRIQEGRVLGRRGRGAQGDSEYKGRKAELIFGVNSRLRTLRPIVRTQVTSQSAEADELASQGVLEQNA